VLFLSRSFHASRPFSISFSQFLDSHFFASSRMAKCGLTRYAFLFPPGRISHSITMLSRFGSFEGLGAPATRKSILSEVSPIVGSNAFILEPGSIHIWFETWLRMMPRTLILEDEEVLFLALIEKTSASFTATAFMPTKALSFSQVYSRAGMRFSTRFHAFPGSAEPSASALRSSHQQAIRGASAPRGLPVRSASVQATVSPVFEASRRHFLLASGRQMHNLCGSANAYLKSTCVFIFGLQ